MTINKVISMIAGEAKSVQKIISSAVSGNGFTDSILIKNCSICTFKTNSIAGPDLAEIVSSWNELWVFYTSSSFYNVSTIACFTVSTGSPGSTEITYFLTDPISVESPS